MQRPIIKINIVNEQDVVLAYRRAMQLSEKCGLALGNQTKFATAVSEISRNVLEYAGSGFIQFNLEEVSGVNYLEALISDRGRGISNPDIYLNNPKVNKFGRGLGLYNSKKLVDFFEINSILEQGTKVILRKQIPNNVPYISKALIEKWVSQFFEDNTVSPYAEMKRQNIQLLELLEELNTRNEQTEEQLEEIKRLNLQLNNVNQDLDAFAHTISHDLRAPMQNIGGLVTALEACLEANDVQEAMNIFPLLRQQSFKMDKMIVGILAYSLAGRQQITKRPVDLQILLYEVITSLHIPESIKINIQPNLPVLLTEEVYLHQVFSNLISNAIKYHDNPETGKIDIGYKVCGEVLEFFVADNGPGIEEANQTKIFNFYESLGNSLMRKDSTGLGLSIVKKIVQEKGCSINVESEGRGSKFIFTWPNEIIET